MYFSIANYFKKINLKILEKIKDLSKKSLVINQNPPLDSLTIKINNMQTIKQIAKPFKIPNIAPRVLLTLPTTLTEKSLLMALANNLKSGMSIKISKKLIMVENRLTTAGLTIFSEIAMERSAAPFLLSEEIIFKKLSSLIPKNSELSLIIDGSFSHKFSRIALVLSTIMPSVFSIIAGSTNFSYAKSDIGSLTVKAIIIAAAKPTNSSSVRIKPLFAEKIAVITINTTNIKSKIKPTK